MKMQLLKAALIALAAIAISGAALAQDTGDTVSATVAPTPPPDRPAPVTLPRPAEPGALPAGLLPDFSPETSPEVAIAEAQLRQAEAKLRQAKIEAAQRAIESSQAERVADLARQNVKELEMRVNQGVGSHQELLEAQERLAQAEAVVAKQQAATKIMEAPGAPPGGLPEMGFLRQPRIPAPRPEFPKEDKSEIARALVSPVTIEFEKETLRNISDFISEYVGINIVMDVGLQAADEPVTVKLQDVPLKNALLALADTYGDLCFVVRDYGIFATTLERAMTINAPAIPANVPLLVSIQDASAGGISGGFPAGFGFGTVHSGGSFGGGFGEGIPGSRLEPGALGGRGVRGMAPGGLFPGAVGGSSSAPIHEAKPSTEATYQVKQGDTLESIAQQFGVTTDQLRKWNGMGDGAAVKIGQELTIKQQ